MGKDFQGERKQPPVESLETALSGDTTAQSPEGDSAAVRPDKNSHAIRLLKKSRREFLMVFDSVPAMIWYRDPAGKILRVNQCAADSVNRSVNELVGKNYYDLFPDGAERSRQQDLQVIRSGQPLRQQLRRFKAFDGRSRWAMVDRIPLRDKKAGKIAGVMVFAQDVTEQKKAEEHLVRAKKEIEIRNAQLQSAVEKAQNLAKQADQSNRAKSEVLANSSHDLRTPMNAIIGFSELMRDTELDEEQSDYVETINKSATGLLSLINDILDYTKLEAGKLNVQIIACSIAAFMDEIKSMMSPGATQKGLDFQVHIDSSLAEEFFTDPVRLKQCLINLIGNAIKFTHQGHVAVHVKRGTKGLQDSIRFEVEDTGIGIAPDKQEAIFQAFSQAEKTTDRTYGGTGLGLSITRRLADLLGGHITVSSQPQKGSVFSIVLPLFTEAHRCRSRLGQTVEKQRTDDQLPVSGDCILVADDNIPSQVTMNLLLRRVGLTVETASSTEDVFKRIHRSRVDMMLLDLTFGGGRGLELIRQLHDNNIAIPVIAIGDYDETLCQAAIDAGANRYLPKPVMRRQLYEAMAEVRQQAAFEAQYQENREADLTSELSCVDRQESDEPMVQTQQISELLEELLAELRTAFENPYARSTDDMIDLLCQAGQVTQDSDFIEKVDQLRVCFQSNPEQPESVFEILTELENLCRELPIGTENASL